MKRETSLPNANSSALVVSGLTFSYNENRVVLQDINLEVFPGERVGLIGPNGVGKTTFFLLVCGVLRPGAGAISLFGEPLDYGSFRPEVGLVFQNPDDQLFSPSVWDDVAFGPQNLGLSKKEVASRVEEALKTTGVSDLAHRAPHHLSEGEKRMVSTAGVLSMHPQLVIYDEPSANLDIRSRRRLIRFLQVAQETLLIASHDLELILDVCTRMVLLDEGRFIADGDPREIMANVALMEAHGLERPHSLTPHIAPHHSTDYVTGR